MFKEFVVGNTEFTPAGALQKLRTEMEASLAAPLSHLYNTEEAAVAEDYVNYQMGLAHPLMILRQNDLFLRNVAHHKLKVEAAARNATAAAMPTDDEESPDQELDLELLM
eukprot:TRINITY_DN23593_c0_g1_i1.p1 TRINITY_DN23593_c0_g1~~TRINITY_DN23593_c0_g1_i1.p1  ORF type:complete len:110 (-),score=12.14 TRINITY_DN23593_c0_g1_i1:17-346(-)